MFLWTKERSYLLESREGGILSKMKHFIQKTQNWPLEKRTDLGDKKWPLAFLYLCEISLRSILFLHSVSYWATFWWHNHFQTSGVSSHTRERVPWVCWKCLFFHGELINLLVCALPSISWEFGFYKPVPKRSVNSWHTDKIRFLELKRMKLMGWWIYWLPRFWL